MKVKTKDVTLLAFQFSPAHQTDGVCNMCLATMEHGDHVHASTGIKSVHPGEWIVRDPNTAVPHVISDSLFHLLLGDGQ